MAIAIKIGIIRRNKRRFSANIIIIQMIRNELIDPDRIFKPMLLLQSTVGARI
jgi:hypothetical protein